MEDREGEFQETEREICVSLVVDNTFHIRLLGAISWSQISWRCPLLLQNKLINSPQSPKVVSYCLTEKQHFSNTKLYFDNKRS